MAGEHVLLWCVALSWCAWTFLLGLRVQVRAVCDAFRIEKSAAADLKPGEPPLREIDGILYRGKFHPDTGKVSGWVEAEVQSRDAPRVVR